MRKNLEVLLEVGVASRIFAIWRQIAKSKKYDLQGIFFHGVAREKMFGFSAVWIVALAIANGSPCFCDFLWSI